MEMGKLLRCISRVRPPANAQVNTVRGQGCCWLVLDGHGRLPRTLWHVGASKPAMFFVDCHHRATTIISRTALPSELLDHLCLFTNSISGYDSLSTS